jgi:hypothetical protein
MPHPDAPTRYEVRVRGHLDPHWSAWFGGLTVTHEDDGTTTLRGPVADRVALPGLLARVRDVGATLISVSPDDTVPGPPRPSDTNGPTAAMKSSSEP